MDTPTRHILVVDDDSAIRREICGFLEEYCRETGVSLLAYEAENGQKAVETVCARPIDLIFSDIKMPLCTGTQMMEKLRALGYTGQIVIISGFEDYHLIRSSMKLGAVDYLLKPIAQEEFGSILGDCLRRVGERASRHAVSAGTPEQLYREQHAVDLLAAGSPEGEGSLPGGSAIVCVADLFHERVPDEARRRSAFVQMQAVVQEALEGAELLQGTYRGSWALVLASPCTADAARELRRALRGQRIRFGCCDRPYARADLPAAFSLCMERLSLFFYDIPDLFTAVQEPFPYESLMKQLVSAVCACDFIGFSGFLSQLFACLCRDRPDLEETRRLLSSILYRAMTQNNALIAVAGQYKFTEHDLLPCIEEATSAMELRRRMMEILHLYMETMQERAVSRDSYNVSKVKQLLEQEYMKEISLTEISERLGIHPNYLSTLFKTETGITYSQYLRSLRVKKASEMMRTTNLKVYEIAERVGYSDTASFYRVFKEELGMSPARYKRSLSE